MSLFGSDDNDVKQNVNSLENNSKLDNGNKECRVKKEIKASKIKVIDDECNVNKVNIELKAIDTFRNIEKSILNQYKNNTLHHSIMISGNYGIGKASFVYYLISKFLEINIEKSSKINNLSDEENATKKNEMLNVLKKNEHPDVFFLNMNTPGDKSKNEITISQIRWIIEKIYLKASFGTKFIIIDDINSINNSGVNAFLKTLEEPPENTYIFIINHRITTLLDTIYSRCSKINLFLSSGECMRVLQQRNDTWGHDKVEFYTDISNNSIAFAEKLAEFDLMKYRDIKSIELKSFLNKIFEVIEQNVDWSRMLKISLIEKIMIYFLNRNLINHLNNLEDAKRVIMFNNNIMKQFDDIKKFELPVLFV